MPRKPTRRTKPLPAKLTRATNADTRAPAKAESKVAAARARLFKLLYANPISGLTPARLVSWLNAFVRGDLRQAVLLWQQIIDRDDQVGPCATKRTRAVARLNWQILPIDDSPEAEKHKATLEHFYNNLSAHDGLNEMERGGVRQLVKQMMSATGMRYAMHEIIWKPAAPGGLTADFKFLPLHFFENTTGRLRFLKTDSDMAGVDLDEHFGPGGWICNAGDGLMIASSVAYLFKTPTGLKAWVSFMEKFGMPGLHAKTSAQKNTPEWDDLVDAVTNYGEDLAIVTNEGASIATIESKTSGNAPHPPLIDRMDRAISRIWLGGDLATMSKDNQAVGSQPQSDDLDTLKDDDAEMITDALNEYVDKEIIRQIYGDTAPLAYFRLRSPNKKTTADSVLRIETGQKYGVEISKAFVRQELSLPEPKPEDDLITAPPVAASPFGAQSLGFQRASNEATVARVAMQFRAASLQDLTEAQTETLRPLVDRLQAILSLPDDKIDSALAALKADLPRLNDEILADPALQAAFENILGTALVAGAATAAEQKKTSAT